MTTVASYRHVSRDIPAALERVRHQPQVKREADYYLENIGRVKSLDDFLGNARIYRFAMEAFGLGEMAYAKAFVRRILTEGIDRRDSFANRLADSRYRELAEVLNFSRYASATTSFARAQQGVVDRFVRQKLEADAGEINEGVKLALYFQRKAPSVSSAYGLLADRALLKVTQVVLGFSEGTSALDIKRQAEEINRKLDIQSLKEPGKLDKLLTSFVARWDMLSPSTSGTSSADLLGGGLGGAINLQTLQQLQHKSNRR